MANMIAHMNRGQADGIAIALLLLVLAFFVVSGGLMAIVLKLVKRWKL